MRFTITSEHTKMRLDKFLKEHFPDLSRAHLQKLIEAGQVTANGKRVAVHHFLKEGDEVEATIEAPTELRVIPNSEVKFDVVHKEDSFIIVNKPAGLVVHQSEAHKEPDTLANGLLAYFPEIAKVGDDPIRPGIVHRLDADVSGTMVVARTHDMFDHLKSQFKKHEVEKEYVALTHGKISPPSGTIEFTVARKGAKMIARPKQEGDKKSITEYETIETFKNLNMAKLRINTRTGRTHQIRVHLFAKGNPIVGDKLYQGVRIQGLETSRLMLHARKIAFKDLDDKWREFIVKPPPEFV